MNNYLQDLLPTNEEEKLIESTEMLVLSVQVALQKIMTMQGVSHAELAGRLGMTAARVSQIFSEKGPNLTLKTIARVAAALGEDFEFLPRRTEKFKSSPIPASFPMTSSWREDTATNDPKLCELRISPLRATAALRRGKVWANGSLERRAA